MTTITYDAAVIERVLAFIECLPCSVGQTDEVNEIRPLYATSRPAENLTQDCGNVRNAGEVLHSDAALQAADRISQILEDQQCGVWVGSNEAHAAIEAYRTARQQMKDQLSCR